MYAVVYPIATLSATEFHSARASALNAFISLKKKSMSAQAQAKFKSRKIKLSTQIKGRRAVPVI